MGSACRWGVLAMFWLAGTGGGEAPAVIPAELKRFNLLVGSWNGVATPQDEGTRFWRETSHWEWEIGSGEAGLKWVVDQGRHFAGGRLTFDPAARRYRLTAERVKGSPLVLSGQLVDQVLELDAPAENGKEVRVTIRLLHENRFQYRVLERAAGRERFHRTLDVGNTRQGVQFAASSAGPTCIVTGGRGTMTVQYQGKTYYVCCTGCQQAFEDEPEKYIAAAKGQAK